MLVEVCVCVKQAARRCSNCGQTLAVCVDVSEFDGMQWAEGKRQCIQVGFSMKYFLSSQPLIRFRYVCRVRLLLLPFRSLFRHCPAFPTTAFVSPLTCAAVYVLHSVPGPSLPSSSFDLLNTVGGNRTPMVNLGRFLSLRSRSVRSGLQSGRRVWLQATNNL